jgi:diguanylate cyclase (GGDEF)-like protein/PAS domain S-box-containing protein
MSAPRSGSAAAALDDADLRMLAGEFQSAPDLFDGLTESIALYRRDGTIVTGNLTAKRLIGRSARELVGQHFSVHIAPQEVDRVSALYARLLADEEPISFETQFIHANGSLIDVEAKLLPARSRGRLVGILGIATDVTVQRQVVRAMERAQQQFRSLFELHPDAITMTDREGKYVRVNRVTEALTGYLQDELIGETAEKLFVPESLPNLDRARSRVMQGEPAEFTATTRNKDGTHKHIEVTSIPIVVDGEVDGMFCVSRDVTERLKSQADFAKLATRIHQLYLLAAATGASPEEQIGDALRLGMAQLGFDWAYVAQVQEDFTTIRYSEGAAGRFPVGHAQARDRTLAHEALKHDGPFVVPDVAASEWAQHPAPIANDWGSYVANRIRLGDTTYGVVLFASREPHAVLGDFDRDYVEAIARLAAFAIERALQSEQLRGMAFFDGLTGLPNRVLLQDRLEQLINLARRHKRAFAVHFIDFDNFKPVNDRYGHAVGDKLIVAMSRRLSEGLRESDTLARFGGDEFVIIQPEITDAEAATELAMRLIESVRQPFTINGNKIEITLSVGIAMFPQDGTTVNKLLNSADAALYSIKNSGRNNVALYESSMKPKAH